MRTWRALCRLITGSVVVLFCFVSAYPDQRNYLQTGPWYPKDPLRLQGMLEDFFRAVDPPRIQASVIRALIAPHAGFRFSGSCAARVYGLLNPRDYDRVILLGASHRFYFSGACVSSYSDNITPLGSLPVDTVVTKELARSPLFMVNNRYLQYEHSLENQLPFLQYVFAERIPSIVPVLIGDAGISEIRKIARILNRYIDTRTLLVVSSDFTHYGSRFSYTPFQSDIRENIRKLDMKILSFVREGDLDGLVGFIDSARPTICGIRPIMVMMEIFCGKPGSTRMIDYLNSGDLTGDYTHCVSYAAVARFARENPGLLTPEEQEILLRLSRRVLETAPFAAAVSEDRMNPAQMNTRLQEQRGVFVTLKKHGKLRGCIGDLDGKLPLYRGVMAKTRDAALRDPRFRPVKAEETGEIQIEISVLTPLREVDDYQSIRLGTDGVVIRSGARGAVFLPQVATETGWGLEQFLSRLCLKGGLPADAYRNEKVNLYVFQVQVFQETE